MLRTTAITNNFQTAKKELLAKDYKEMEYIEKRYNRIHAAVWLGNTRLIDIAAVDEH